MPTYLNPFKENFALDPQIRFNKMKKMCENINKCEVSNWEIRQKKPVPTINTVEHLIKLYDIDRLYLIIGADNLCHIETWEGYDDLKKLTIFIVASRDDIDTKAYKTLYISCPISSTSLREKKILY